MPPGNDDLPFGGTRLGRPLWPHQERALAAFEAARANTGKSAYLVVPPGGGKTLIGLEAARRLERPALVLCPNTAIQAQWIDQWHGAFAPPRRSRATASRDLPTPLTVLTYQAVCALDDGAAVTHRRVPDGELLNILHPNGRSLLSVLKASGPWTLVLDECHHLLEMWGLLLRAIVAELADPFVIGLTATPPHLMTTDQKALHSELFGAVDLEVSAPALVRDGHLAPYQELAFFATPTPSEADYIDGEALRFAELRAGLLDPGFAATPFLEWLRLRIVERRDEASGAQVSWDRFARDDPALADAALRLHGDGLLPLPEGARIREQHRHPPTAEDWVALIGDYCRRCLRPSDDPRDERAYEAIRRALPSIGYRLTRTGSRAAESPVDRVLARSESKARAVTEILRAEAAELGERLRALILTDFAEAGGTVPADLAGVLEEGAGGARLVLETLLADETAAALDPVLMTGQRVACGEGTARRFADWLRTAAPDAPAVNVTAAAPGETAAGGIAEINGGPGWVPRRYVPLVTRFFAEGGCRCLVGTRALLGEGWDAPAVNVVIDLTAAATPTSVVQARGRALRLDQAWAEKVADNWAVVCVTDGHPKGAADYDRFVRKHDRYFALSETGDIISGVAHVDPSLSPFELPTPENLAALNARMLIRAGERSAARDRWNIGEPYADEPVATVTVIARGFGLPREYLPSSALAALGPPARQEGLFGRFIRFWRASRAAAAPVSGSLEDMAMATADALCEAGLVSRDGTAVRLEPLPGGAYRAKLRDVSAAESATFAAALDEVLSPLAQPRYIVPRLFLPCPESRRAAIRLALRRRRGRGVPAAVVYHAVPAVLGGNRKRAQAFARAWNARVSPGEMLYTGSPEGTGILAAQRGDDPFAVTTRIRTLWR
jgi:superfamily II DNA or RNA helicase